MKTQLSFVLLFAAAFLAGCSRKEEPSTPPASSATNPAPSASIETSQKSGADAQAEVQRQAAAGQQAVDAAAKDGVSVETIIPSEAAATPSAAPAPASVQSVLDHAASLVAQKKYAEAAAALSQLSNLSLSAEQQRLVEGLKAQIQSALASDAAGEGLKSVGGLLKGAK